MIFLKLGWKFPVARTLITTCTDGSSGCSAKKEGDVVKIVDVAVKKVYRFNCPNCQSRLEAESNELTDIGGKVSKFYCPVCRKERYGKRS